MAQNEYETGELEEFEPAESTSDGRRAIPRTDIYETTDEYVVLCDMPGVKPTDVDVQFERGHLHLSGKVAKRRHRGRVIEREFDVRRFTRSFSVSNDVETGKILAECNDGLVTLRLPKKESTKPKRIEVHHKA